MSFLFYCKNNKLFYMKNETEENFLHLNSSTPQSPTRWVLQNWESHFFPNHRWKDCYCHYWKNPGFSLKDRFLSKILFLSSTSSFESYSPQHKHKSCYHNNQTRSVFILPVTFFIPSTTISCWHLQKFLSHMARVFCHHQVSIATNYCNFIC